MATLQVKELDPVLIRQLKIAAAREGKTLKDFVTTAIWAAIEISESKAAQERYSKTMLSDTAYKGHAPNCDCAACKAAYHFRNS